MKVTPSFVTCWAYSFTKRMLSQRHIDPQVQHIENGVCTECVNQPDKKNFLTDSSPYSPSYTP